MRHGRGGPALRPGRLCTTPPLLVDARYRAGRAPLGVPSKGSLNEQFRLPQARSPPSTQKGYTPQAWRAKAWAGLSQS
jgi:hypothetical protein